MPENNFDPLSTTSETSSAKETQTDGCLETSQITQLASKIQDLCYLNIELMQKLNTFRTLRVTSLTEMPKVHSLKTASTDHPSVPQIVTQKTLLTSYRSIIDNLEELLDSGPYSSSPAHLEHLHRTLFRLNSHLTRQYAQCKRYNSSLLVIQFFFITPDTPSINRCFLSVPKDSSIELIISRLPSEWNVDMSSNFMPSSDMSHLGPLNDDGVLLWEVPGWLRYLNLGGPVFVSRKEEKSETPSGNNQPKSAGTGKIQKSTRPRHRRRSWKLPELPIIRETPRKQLKVRLSLSR